MDNTKKGCPLTEEVFLAPLPTDPGRCLLNCVAHILSFEEGVSS